MWKKLATIAVAAVLVMLVGSPGASAEIPSGERQVKGGVVEPVYNDETGKIGFVLTPKKAPMKANERAWAPIYIPVYPTGSTVGTLLCQHQPTENCPTHGDGVAGAAAQLEPSVYGGGVLGHDHLLDFPGGADFNIAWEPVLVLFTSKAAANEHLTTDAQIQAAVDRKDAYEVPVPSLTFLCAVVPATIWAHGTPLS